LVWLSDVACHGDRIIRRFERDIFPWIGGRPIAEVTAPELLAVVRRIEHRGALEAAHRALGNCGQVFRYAVATGRAMRDPCGDLRGALPPVKGEHFAATTEPKRVAELLRAMDGYEGTLTVRCALRLAPLVFVRPGELRKAEWADTDLDTAEWRYTITKTKTPHIVPLCRRRWRTRKRQGRFRRTEGSHRRTHQRSGQEARQRRSRVHRQRTADARRASPGSPDAAPLQDQ
jgi:integrase